MYCTLPPPPPPPMCGCIRQRLSCDRGGIGRETVGPILSASGSMGSTSLHTVPVHTQQYR
jgi:hypothetical protein